MALVMSKAKPTFILSFSRIPVGNTVIVLLATLAVALGQDRAHGEIDRQFTKRYHQSFLSARTNWTAAPTNSVRAWEFARAAFDWAEFATNDTQRAQVAVEGIDAARKAILLDPTCAQGHYYLGMNLGQMARTQLLGALKLVSEMEGCFRSASLIDPLVDHAGPDRNLGILYREAPGWPASIGNRSKARTHLKRSVDLGPEYPANHLELLTACLDWKDRRTAEKLLPGVEQCLRNARRAFSGEQWDWSWNDWEQMWKVQQDRFRKLLK